MSKPKSGLFRGTMGERFSATPESIIAGRVAGLDLRAHPIKQKLLSSTALKRIKAKVAKRTATRDEYRALMWNRRIKIRRDDGVTAFWRQERKRILSGQTPTRNWTPQQIEDILHQHKPRYNGKIIESHHAYSVAKYPHLANRGEVIFPTTHNEHFKGWHGGNYKRSRPGKRIKLITDF